MIRFDEQFFAKSGNLAAASDLTSASESHFEMQIYVFALSKRENEILLEEL